MRIKELFTIPKGKKITQRAFGAALLSSVCSILLCMVCLVGATWAWFTVEVENRDNEIIIATVKPIVEVKMGENSISPANDGGYSLETGTYTVGVRLENNAAEKDDLNQSGEAYVVMIVTHNGQTESYYLTLTSKDGRETYQIQLGSGTAAVSFSASWIKPAAAAPVDSATIVIGEVLQEPETNFSESTTTEATGSVEGLEETDSKNAGESADE